MKSKFASTTAFLTFALSGLTAAQTAELVTIQKGDIPLIISAPHGGTLEVPGVPERTGESVQKKVGAKTNFSKAFDAETDKMAVELSEAIFKRLGKRPYVVVAYFSRKYIDANRPASDAYENPLAKPVYDQYHGAILQARREILSRWQAGLLIDLHGQGSRRDAIFRGTADFATVRGLLGRAGQSALLGPQGLLGSFAARGATMIPANEAIAEKENPALNGGFIVRQYGSSRGGNFDAIQFEFGASYRREDRPKTVEALADSLSEFVGRYLSEPVHPTSD